MENLKSLQSLVVQQKKEWGEIITGFETKNRYAISDEGGRQLYWAAEESSTIARLFLKALRPFSIHILSMEGRPVINAEKPFRFYFHEMTVFSAEGNPMGCVKREFSLLEKKFTITGAQGGEMYSIRAPLLHPWTFTVSKGGMETGKIVKKWSGLGKEAFTDADNFSVTFPQGAGPDEKAALLGALFLIDMVYFEK